MRTRWNRFYKKQMENGRLQELVEAELKSLRLGVQIAKLRERARMTQTELAAKAEMSTPKISVLESRPKDAKVSTLIRIARALDRDLDIRFVSKKRAKEPREQAANA